MRRKALSLLLACVMLFSITVPAYAEETVSHYVDENGNSTTITYGNSDGVIDDDGIIADGDNLDASVDEGVGNPSNSGNEGSVDNAGSEESAAEEEIPEDVVNTDDNQDIGESIEDPELSMEARMAAEEAERAALAAKEELALRDAPDPSVDDPENFGDEVEVVALNGPSASTGGPRKAPSNSNLTGVTRTLSGNVTARYTCTGTNNITLNAVTMDFSAFTDAAYPCFLVSSGTTTFILTGESTLKAGGPAAAIQVANGATVHIKTTDTANPGKLTVYGGSGVFSAGAGIGSAPNSAAPGLIYLDGGTIYAYGGPNVYYGAAGIGSGSRGTQDTTKGIYFGHASYHQTNSSGNSVLTVYAYGSQRSMLGGAGIGGGHNTNAGNIYVYNGSVNAYASESYISSYVGAAGIGSGGQAMKQDDITVGGSATENALKTSSGFYIYGGAVYAQGYRGGAGIGGGSGFNAQNIQISGGNVTAYGENGGAGIGGGGWYKYPDGVGKYHYGGFGASISISGAAKVDAYGHYGGAGIGGGAGGDGYSITINGEGRVRAYGGDGAAIGGGVRGNGYNITLQGPSDASKKYIYISSGSGAGIGGGAYGGGFNLTLKWLEMYGAVEYGAYIGSGAHYGPTRTTSSSNYGHAYSGTITRYDASFPSGTSGSNWLTNVSVDSCDIGSSSSRITLGTGTVIGVGYETYGTSNTAKLNFGAWVSNSNIYARGRQSSYTYHGTGLGVGYGSKWVNGVIKVVNCPNVSYAHGSHSYNYDIGIGIMASTECSLNLQMSNCTELSLDVQNGVGLGVYGGSSNTFNATVSGASKLSTSSWYSYSPTHVGIGVASSPSSVSTFNLSSVDKIESTMSYRGVGIGVHGDVGQTSFTFTNCPDISANGGRGGYISGTTEYDRDGGVGIGVANSNNSTKKTFAFTNCDKITAGGGNRSVGIGVSNSSYNCDVDMTFTGTGEINVAGTGYASTGIGVGVDSYQNDVDITFNNYPTVTVANNGSSEYVSTVKEDGVDVNQLLSSVGIGAGCRSYYNDLDIKFVGVTTMAVSATGGWSSGIGSASFAHDNDILVDIDGKSSGTTTASVTCGNGGTAIGWGPRNYDSSTSYPSNLDIDIDVTELTVNGVNTSSVPTGTTGIGVGYRANQTNSQQTLTADINLGVDKLLFGDSGSNYEFDTGIGVGSKAGKKIQCDITVRKATALDMSKAKASVAIGVGQNSGNDTAADINLNVVLPSVQTISVNAGNTAIGTGSSVKGTDCVFEWPNVTSLTVAGSTTGIGNGDSNSFNDLTVSLPKVTALNVTASDAGVGIGTSSHNISQTMTFTGATHTVTSTGNCGIGASRDCRDFVQNINISPSESLTVTASGDSPVGIGVGPANRYAEAEFTVTTKELNVTAGGNYGVGIGTGAGCGAGLAINIQATATTGLTVNGKNVGIGLGGAGSNNTTDGSQLDIKVSAPKFKIIVDKTNGTGVGVGPGTKGNFATTLTMRMGSSATQSVDHLVKAADVGVAIGSGTGCGARDGYVPHLTIDWNNYGANSTKVLLDAVTGNNGVAVGSGNSSDDVETNIIIKNQSILNANGGNSASSSSVGIGAGQGSSKAKTTISIQNCATVNAMSNTATGNSSYTGNGVGIGVGGSYKGSTAGTYTETNPCVSITITGASTITAKGGQDGAGIGTGSAVTNCPGLLVKITGSPTITATAGTNAAGIGTGNKNSGNGVKMWYRDDTSAETITATSLGAAGMGLGNNADGGTVDISLSAAKLNNISSANGPSIGIGHDSKNGSTATISLTNCPVIGQVGVATGHAAGIGMGLNNNQAVMNLTLKNTSLTAKGSKGGAGFGTGPMNSACLFSLTTDGGTLNGAGSYSEETEYELRPNGNAILDNILKTKILGAGAGIGTSSGINGVNTLILTVNGGTVTGTGAGVEGLGSAGIGGGTSNAGGNIVINGGTVTGIGMADGAGIGGGYRGDGALVTINGGTVYATGGPDGASGMGGGTGAVNNGKVKITKSVSEPKLYVTAEPNYNLAIPGEVELENVRLFQGTLLDPYDDETTLTVKQTSSAGNPQNVTLKAKYGAFAVTTPSTASNSIENSVYNGGVKMATLSQVEDFPMTNSVVTKALQLTEIVFYTVSFDTGDGGSEVESQIIRAQGTVSMPTSPSRTGYAFAGWFSDPECENSFDFSAQVNSDTTVYAKWIEGGGQLYTVEHYKENEDEPDGYFLATREYFSGDEGDTAVAVPKEFVGYHLASTDKSVESGVITSNPQLALKVYYDKDEVTVNFLNVEADDVSYGHPLKLKYGTYVVLGAPERDGWEFDCWTKGDEDGEKVQIGRSYRIDTLGSNLYANWRLLTGVKYMVRYYLRQPDGSYTLALKEDFAAETANITVWAEKKEFDGYTLNESIYETVGSATVRADGSTVLRVYYDPNPITVQLVNGYLDIDSITKDSGTKADIPTPSREGYAFMGWYKEDGMKLADDALINDCGSKLTARWQAANTTAYQVRYYTQDVTQPSSYNIYAVEDKYGVTDSPVTVPTKSISGFSLNTALSTATGTISGHDDLVLKMYYDADSYTVSFDSKGGSAVASQSGILYGGHPTKPANPTKQGYEFDCWCVDEDCGVPFDFIYQPVLANMTLYARWTPSSDTPYKVEHYTENSNGSYTLARTDTLEGETDSIVNAVPVAFTGYTEDKTNTSRVGYATLAADGSTVLKLYYKRIFVTVTYESNGGEPVSDARVRYGETAAEPTPTRVGYTFGGWYTNVGLTREFNFSVSLTDDITLYAKWIPNEETVYKVEYYLQNLSNPQEYTLDKTETKHGATESIISATIYAYEGFHENQAHASRKVVGTIAANGSTVLKVYYDRNVYKLYLDHEGGEGDEYVTALYQGKFPIPQSSKTGYVFDGWWTDAVTPVRFDFNQAVTKDRKAIAGWKSAENTAYTVEHYLQNVSQDDYVLADEDDLIGTTDATVQAASKEFYGFEETTEYTGAVRSGKVKPDGSLVLKLYYDRLSFPVSFVSNGGSRVENIDVVYENATGALPEPTRDGYEFAGWYADAELTEIFDTTAPVTAAATAYASWVANGDTGYVVKYYKQTVDGADYEEYAVTRGTGDTDSTVTVSPGVPYGFSLNTEKSVRSGVVTADGLLTLSVYFDRNSVDVTLSVDGVEDTVQVLYGATLEADTPRKAGYVFGGWLLDGDIFAADTAIEEPITLTAKWVEATDTGYRVEHYRQAGNTYDLYETEEFTGMTGSSVTAEPKEYSGYQFNADHEDSVLSGTVQADGGLVLKVFYSKKYVPVIITPPKPVVTVYSHSAYVCGYTDGTVRPKQKITRAEAAALFYRLFPQSTRAEKPMFTDVTNENAWYYSAVQALAYNNLVAGYKDGTFRPANSITRAEFTAMLVRFGTVDESKTETIEFVDVPETNWAHNPISVAASQGWVYGVGDGHFNPNAGITRAEAIAMLNRMLGRQPIKNALLLSSASCFSDLDKDAWYYADILEATVDHHYTKGESDEKETWVASK